MRIKVEIITWPSFIGLLRDLHRIMRCCTSIVHVRSVHCAVCSKAMQIRYVFLDFSNVAAFNIRMNQFSERESQGGDDFRSKLM